MTTDERYMWRCLELAGKAAGDVAPNPMVGAVLVHNDVIIGEGYHQLYGQAHAEVNCVKSIKDEHRHLIEQSTMYVSLEPCAHYGKTPPCADLITRMRIPRVVIGCRDSYKEVAGRGIEKLQHAKVDVLVGVLEKECRDMNKRFFTFHEKQRPYIILKWAQSTNRLINSHSEQRTFISNEYSNRLVHKWRSEEAGILVGRNTAQHDNPSLTSRLYKGRNPVRIVLDSYCTLSREMKLFNGEAKTIVINSQKGSTEEHAFYCKVQAMEIVDVLQACYEQNINSILVEGGSKTLQSFINCSLWDEARVITNETMFIKEGIAAPTLVNASINRTERLIFDRIDYYTSGG
jgi:diaminohydroxyphosphoribosylaminopyrimidine deaminase / 5-amino-6-(5-phosphoribosylamino)uracil reductase